MYAMFADIILVLHSITVLFIIAGFFAFTAGALLGKKWAFCLPLRLFHLAAIFYVVLQAWLGRLCPLTDLENWLRVKGGEGAYGTTFISYWLQRMIYYDFDFIVFQIAYSVFGILVLLQWIIWPPHKTGSTGKGSENK